MNVLETALDLNAKGFAAVFQQGKRAIHPGWNSKVRTAEDLRQEYRDGLNVAVVTGLSAVHDKRLVVVDLDIRSEAHKQAAWEALQQYIGKVPPTTKTGGGGAHWWFWMPANGFPRENKLILAHSAEKADNKPAWAIEVLLNGHACTCPPSIHPSGRPYGWVNGGASHVPDAPESLVTAIRTARPVEQRKPEALPPKVSLISAATIVPEPIRWLWDGFLAAGKLHMLAGVPGTGKTTLALVIAATLSIGGRWPDNSRAPKRNIVIWSGEDDPKDTLVPRLMAMGADMARVRFVGKVSDEQGIRPFDPATDIELLRDAIPDFGDVGLVVIDPIVSAVSGDSHKNAEVRRSLQPLVDLALAADCAILGISHFTKNSKDRDPLERLTGAGAFGALPRIVMAAAKKIEEDGTVTRLMVRTKSNIGPDGGGFSYHLEQIALASHADVIASRITWGQSIEGTAREILADAEIDGGADEQFEQKDAAGFLNSLLSSGPMTAGQIFKEAKEAGYGERAIQRASTKLRVERRKAGMGGGWVWTLPKTTEDAREKILSPSSSSAPSVAFEGAKATPICSRNLLSPSVASSETETDGEVF